MIAEKLGKVPIPDFWVGKKVLITGHTGFKGGWLAIWLNDMGAKVHGLALDPITQPNLYSVADIKKLIETDVRADIRNERAVCKAFERIQPEIVFHLAAQALVHPSYKAPIYTFETNSMGTAHVLEAIRLTKSIKVAVMITTDKVYENKEWPYLYREVDQLGGFDPYSASKACAEIMIDSYRRSFLKKQEKSIASVRAGNVIGGGDWSEDRLVPDAMKAFALKKILALRNPESTRPWQHVLEPLCGYLLLAQAQWTDNRKFARAWNFAPDNCIEATVGKISEAMAELWGVGAKVKIEQKKEALHESNLLALDASLAHIYLDWKPKWSLSKALKSTVDWYKAFGNNKNMYDYSLDQIKEYVGG